MRRLTLPLSALVIAAGCRTDDPAAPQPTRPDPDLGLSAFQADCAGCHASADGFDLAVFGFTDTTIIRRAVAHVDTATALHIVAHVRATSAPGLPENTRLFQPRGSPTTSDVQFALDLFGRDAWPAELTTGQLRAVDPRQVRIALQLPVWSDEVTNLDWMPDTPLPPGVLSYAGSAPAAAIAGYRAAPTRENLLRAVTALRTADRALANAAAPCVLDDPLRVKYRECFEVRRWTSTLVAQHMLRYGMNASLGAAAHDVWWDVGNVARRSRADATQPIARAVENWATWMFLGWSFEPSRHASVYTGGGLRQLGLARHATFIALRSQVARPPNGTAPYQDLLQAARFAPMHWVTAATSFGLRHLRERLQQGDRPVGAEQLDQAVMAVNAAVAEAIRKAPADRLPLETLAQEVLAALVQ